VSSNIWTQCADASKPAGRRAPFRTLRLSPWRVVEAQHQVSTRKLVDSLEEQALLEQLIETAKPPSRAGTRLHVLLSTPFRYPPLPHGSRFGTRHEPGIWYGSEDRRALFAELAYYRLVFMEASAAGFETLTTWHTAFSVRVQTGRGIDLTRPPFDAHRPVIASPTDYRESQALGAAMRAEGVEAFRYPSARDTAGGLNVGVFVSSVFGAAKPRRFETWHCTATPERIEVVRRDFFEAIAFTFLRAEFLVDGSLPAPALAA
jgi:hypothetical protein